METRSRSPSMRSHTVPLQISVNQEEEKNIFGEDDIDEFTKPNTLEIRVIEARGLRSSTIRSTVSAYVKLRCGSKEDKTTVKSKTREPYWDESFSFPALDWTSTAVLIISDKVNIKKRFIGQVRVSTSELSSQSDQQMQKWLTLHDKTWEPKPNLGEIYIEAKWIYKSVNDPILARRSIAQAEKLKDGGLIPLEDFDDDIDDEGLFSDDEEINQEWHPDDLEGVIVEQDDETEEEKILRKLELLEQQKQMEEIDTSIKRGDYQFQVHIIEARDLKGEDVSGSSDPICYVEIMGKKKHTEVKTNTVGCVFDEMFFFQFKDIGREELQEASIKFSVYDSNKIMRDTMIGVHQIDCTSIYYKPHHQLYRQWVALMDYASKDDRGIQGFLMITATILGPGDEPKVHDRDAEIIQEFSGELAADANAMILLPPSIEQHLNFLVVTVYKAEDLPAMDESGLLSSSGIDAFIRIDFAGNPKCKTSVVTVKGSGSLCPVFLEELWVPVMVPTMANRIGISVWDWDRGRANDLVARVSYDFANVVEDNRPGGHGTFELPPISPGGMTDPQKLAQYNRQKALSSKRWVNLYGPPLTFVNKKEAAKIANYYPDLASTYRGRVLVSFRRVTNPDINEKENVHSKDIEDLDENWEEVSMVPTLRYTLRAIVICGVDLPKFPNISGGYSKMKLTVSIGSTVLDFEPAAIKNTGKVVWNQSKEKRGIVLPADYTQLPDIFLHLYRQNPADKLTSSTSYIHVSYKRIRASDIIQQEFEQPPFWCNLEEDVARRRSRYGLPSLHTFPGASLVRLGFGREEIAARKPWSQDYQALNETIPHQLRVHIYQCKDLSFSSANNNQKVLLGTSEMNPYVQVQFNGLRKVTKRKSKTYDPLYYETLLFDCDLNGSADYIPDIVITLFHYDRFSVIKQQLLGNVRIPYASAVVKTSSSHRQAPRPKWYSLQDGGSILASFQSVEKRTKTETLSPPLPIVPSYRSAFVDIIALGVRNLKPYQFLPIQRPYISFEVTGHATKKNKKNTRRKTKPSHLPNGANANFLERIIMPVELPVDPLFSPQLKIQVYDTRLGGLQTSMIASTRIYLNTKIPWNTEEYIPPQQQKFDCADKILEEQELSKECGKFSDGEEATDASPGEVVPEDIDVDLEEGGEENAFLSPRSHKKELEMTDDGTGVGELELRPVVQTTSSLSKIKNDPVMKEKQRFEKQRRYYAALQDAKKKGITYREKGFDSLDMGSLPRNEIEFEKPGYLNGRDWWINTSGNELEAYLKTAPFETYSLHRSKDSQKIDAGRFKGLIRIVENDPTNTSNPFLDFHQLSEPKPFEVRLYVLKGTALQPKDRNGLADPYLKVKLGKTKINRRKQHCKKTLNPLFYDTFIFQTFIPGPSQLEVKVYDYDLLLKDSLIGSTFIDLEDRWFHSKWQHIGVGHPSGVPCLKPIEYRSLWNKTASTPQGMLQVWVDIIDKNQSEMYSPIDIKPPPNEKFEVRVIVWKSDEVIDRDMSEMNDLFVTVWLEGMKSQSTDVHWRCSTGRAAWNYRLIFPVELPLKAPEFARLHVQLWDKDVIKWNDVIGETQLDLYKWFQIAYRKKETVYPFKELKQHKHRNDVEGIQIDEENCDEEQYSDEELNIDNDQVDLEAGTKEQKPLLSSRLEREKDDKKAQESIRLKKKASRDQNEAKEAISSFLDFIGMGRLPEDAEWITMYHTDREQGVAEKMGQVAISVQIVPEKEALATPVGKGRDDPNVNPYLPPPVGRMKVSANPIMLAKEIVGPKTCAKIFCLFCCVFCMGFVALFGAGIMSTLTFINQTSGSK